MKIVHIATTCLGGAGIAAFRLHQNLLKDGVNSSFIQRNIIDEELKNKNVYRVTHFHNLYYRIVNRLGLKPYLIAEDNFERIMAQYPNNYELITYPTSKYPIEKNQIVKDADIVHIHWAAEFLNYPSFFRNIKQPIVWTLHDMNPFMGIFHYKEDLEINEKNMGDWEQKAVKVKRRAVYNHNNLNIVCPSEWMKNQSQDSYILGSFNHKCIPYGLDFNNYPVLNREKIKQDLGLNNGKKNILFVAQYISVRRKGMDLLIEALNRISSEKYNLICIGADNNFQFSSGLKVIQTGTIKDIKEINKYYSAADVTIIPSREDNLPNVMLESFANGTPVISFKNGGMAEHVEPPITGILINEVNADALKKGVEEFLNDKYTFDRQVIREYAEKNFSAKNENERYINLYNSILNK